VVTTVTRMTDRWVRSASVEKGRIEFVDAVVRGLRLRVSARSKSWSVMSRASGRLRRIAIGDYPDITLSVARMRADKLISGITPCEGVDWPKKDTTGGSESPISVVDGASALPTLETLCADYVARMRHKGQAAADTYERTLISSRHSLCAYVKTKLGRNPLALEVTKEHIVGWLREGYLRSPSHTRHIRAYAHAAFEWALKAEFDFTTPQGARGYGVTSNPVRATPTGPGVRPRKRVLSENEIAELWRLLPDAARPRIATSIRMIISMGGLRVSEITASKKSFYHDGWLHIPKTKNDREHIVPLTRHGAIEYGRAADFSTSRSEFLFPNEWNVEEPMPLTSTSRAVKRLIDDHGLEPFQLRDLRRTFKTLLLENDLVDERSIDIWHNHGQKSDVARKHYTWAEYRSVKERVANAIDAFLDGVLRQ